MRSKDTVGSQEALDLVALASLVVALFGTYWDDAWHTDVGRDAFWSPPHLFLYAGIGLAGATLGARTLALLLATRSLRATLREPGLLVGILGVAATLASAPIDEAWHRSFGRDAVAWSPPHLLGLVGVLLIVGGVQLDLLHLRSRLAEALRVVAAGATLAALLVVVFEYDSDVPQFSTVWYLPLLAGGTTLAASIATRHVRGDWPAAKAAGVYTALMMATIFALIGMGFSAPILPLVLLPAIAYDLAARRRASIAVRALAVTLTVWLVYPGYLSLLPGVRVGLGDALVGLPLSFALCVLALLSLRPPRAGAPSTLAAMLVLLLVPTAAAHDPGQGEPVVPVRLEGSRIGGGWTVIADVSGHCEGLDPDGLVARRAGEEVREPFVELGGCRYQASFVAPEAGRWFAYAQFRLADGKVAEAWIPLHPGDPTSAKSTHLYVPPAPTTTRGRDVAGALLLVAEGALLALLLRAHRAARMGGPA